MPHIATKLCICHLPFVPRLRRARARPPPAGRRSRAPSGARLKRTRSGAVLLQGTSGRRKKGKRKGTHGLFLLRETTDFGGSDCYFDTHPCVPECGWASSGWPVNLVKYDKPARRLLVHTPATHSKTNLSLTTHNHSKREHGCEEGGACHRDLVLLLPVVIDGFIRSWSKLLMWAVVVSWFRGE